MPRIAREKGLFQTYHIVQRGNNKEKVFETREDKQLFLNILFLNRIRYGFFIHAYCIMNNHYHLLISDNGEDISRIMKNINYTYAKYFNHICNRTGHVFQERFFSEIIDTEAYLYTAINYIHNNPVRSGIVVDESLYEWSSCR